MQVPTVPVPPLQTHAWCAAQTFAPPQMHDVGQLTIQLPDDWHA